MADSSKQTLLQPKNNIQNADFPNGYVDGYSGDDLIQRLGHPVILRGSSYSKDRETISLSFYTKNGEIIRLQMKQEEAKLLQNLLSDYLPVKTCSQNEKSSGIPIEEVSRPQDGRKV